MYKRQAPVPPQQEASVHDLLRSIQNQMALQTIQMGKLAEKDDLRELTDRVGVLTTDVASHSAELSSIRRVQDEDREAFNEKLEELDQKIKDLSERGAAGGPASSSSSFLKERHQLENYNMSRRSLRLWPVSVPPLDGEDDSDQFLRLRAAVYLFMADFLKVDKPEELEIEDLIVQRPMRRGNVKNEVLVTFTNVSERDEVIAHAANLKDSTVPAGVRLDIPSHLQSDFKILIQYGNEARAHFGGEVKRLSLIHI